VAQELKKSGFENVYPIKGGWKEWKEDGYPIEPIKKEG